MKFCENAANAMGCILWGKIHILVEKIRFTYTGEEVIEVLTLMGLCTVVFCWLE